MAARLRGADWTRLKLTAEGTLNISPWPFSFTFVTDDRVSDRIITSTVWPLLASLAFRTTSSQVFKFYLHLLKFDRSLTDSPFANDGNHYFRFLGIFFFAGVLTINGHLAHMLSRNPSASSLQFFGSLLLV